MISKLLIANRGAIARRIVRACHDLGIASVVVYSEADSGAPYLSEASEAYPLKGLKASDSYLDEDQLLAIAKASGADSVHPGYGFLAENPGFAQRVIDNQMVFVGPSAHWIEQMGDKVNARRIMADAGLSMLPGSGLIDDPQAAYDFAEEAGFPLVVKPAGGGGGMGMQVVHERDGLLDAIAASQAIAASAFASSGVYLERWLQAPRHIEYQLLADERGNVMHVYERECSVQRRQQKLIEESPAPGLSASFVQQQAEQVAAICAALGYNNIGTVETLLGAGGEVGFLEMNTRIQVEHGVTEAVTGLDLVQQQIQLASGGQLPELPQLDGFAVEARIYAEDAKTMLPSTGTLRVFRPPTMHGIRIETGYQEGQEVSPFYDALLAKVIAKGNTRAQAIGRAMVALQAFNIQGVQSNSALLIKILQDKAFLAGAVDTGIVARVLATAA